MKRRFDVFFTVLIIGLLFCAPKPFQWEGQYVKINTTEQPKEDFVVGNYIVVAYAPCEYKKNITRYYKFALIQNGKQVGLITLDRHDLIVTAYYLEESGFSRNDLGYYLSASGNHITYYIYKNKPNYERVKSDVTTLLSGGELFPEPFDK